MTTDIETKYDTDHLAVCMIAICDPQMASNPVAWFSLDQAGITREHMQAQVDAGSWMGPPPLFDQAPDRDSEFWKMMKAEGAA